ncbi:hypothetical protein AMJ86_09770 [bacterium SM23_57]|jgi:hypothetical protein|nr:MAG: hypothetical protein AMJ86_09770 [bacterium SM23_57]
MKLTKKAIRQMMRSLQTTHLHELSCGECFDEVDRFAEIELTGKNPAEAMPLIHEHLDRCGTCREEYEALLEALKSIAD